MQNAIRILTFATFLATGAALAHADDHTLRDFGGCAGVKAATADFVTRVVQDKCINHYFARVNGARLIELISSQICGALGGPCTYTGRSMKDTHRGMGITTAQFNALVEDLCDTMDHARIPAHSQNRLLGKLAPMWRDIVTK